MVSRLDKAAIENSLKECCSKFTGNAIDIQAMSGPTYPSMFFTVFEYVPRHEEFMTFNYIQSPMAHGPKTFTTSYGPPICLSKFEQPKIKNECIKHVKRVSKMPRNIEETEKADTSIVVWKTMDAVIRYQTVLKNIGKVSFILSCNCTELLTDDRSRRTLCFVKQRCCIQ